MPEPPVVVEPPDAVVELPVVVAGALLLDEPPPQAASRAAVARVSPAMAMTFRRLVRRLRRRLLVLGVHNVSFGREESCAASVQQPQDRSRGPNAASADETTG